MGLGGGVEGVWGGLGGVNLVSEKVFFLVSEKTVLKKTKNLTCPKSHSHAHAWHRTAASWSPRKLRG